MSNIIFKVFKYLKKHPIKILSLIICIVILITLHHIFPINNVKEKPIKKEEVKTAYNGEKQNIPEPTTEIILKTPEEIAEEVLKGLWGNGTERYEKLECNGYDPVSIQKIVETKLSENKLKSSVNNKQQITTTNSVKEIAYTVWCILLKHNYSQEICAGILGNIQQECNFNYNSSSNSGIGICQWGGSRRYNLISKYGENPSLESQVLFLIEELKSYNGILNCTTVCEATDYFCYKFERPGIPRIEKRRLYAEYWYDMFNNK